MPNDELTQSEKLQHLHNDLLVHRTYLAHAQSSWLEVGGRYASARPEVTGVPMVPRLPEGSPWHHDPTGKEPPLGYSVDE
jgi:hypothetical protein